MCWLEKANVAGRALQLKKKWFSKRSKRIMGTPWVTRRKLG